MFGTGANCAKATLAEAARRYTGYRDGHGLTLTFSQATSKCSCGCVHVKDVFLPGLSDSSSREEVEKLCRMARAVSKTVTLAYKLFCF